MSGEEYILKEERLIEKAQRSGINPEEWISRNAQSYCRKHVKSINPVCRPWFTYINNE